MLRTHGLLVGLVGSFFLAACSATPGGGDDVGADGPDSGSGSGSAPQASGSSSSNPGAGGGPGQVGGGSPGGGPGTDGRCVPGVTPTSQLTRLTNAQYDKTVFALLGVSSLSGSPPSTLLVPDQTGSMTDQMWGAYQNVAEQIASQVMADETLKAKYLKCSLTGDGSQCLNDTAVEFGRRAYRRPLSPEETTRFQKLVTDGPGMTENGTPEEVAELLLYGFLISPGFLQREELTETTHADGTFALSSHEVASRLSYMLTGTMPDEMLSQAADQDALQSPEQILEQAKRLLDTPGAREIVAAYHRKYMGYAPGTTRWDSPARVGKSPTFAGFSKDLVPAILAETEKLFDSVTFEKQGSFKDLLLTNVGFVTSGTAPLYGLSGSFTNDLTEVTLGDDRPGFLTRLAFLTGFSDFDRSSPILRGAFITKNVLGVQIGAPDPNALSTPLPEGADLDTNRKQVDAQTSGGACAECHHPYINPPGFVMEAFDTVGATQTTERLTGATIDTSAEIALEFNGTAQPVANPAEMMNLIAHAPQASRFYAQSIVSSAFERLPNSNDACIVEDLGQKLADGYAIKDLLADLTQSESFLLRTVEGN
jgi:hypothetical protein